MEKQTVSFHFRTDEQGNKRDSVHLDIPMHTSAELISILERGDTDNTVEYIHEALASVVSSQVRELLKDDLEFDQAKLDALVEEGKIGIEYLASIPRATANRVTNEDLANFGTAFVQIAIAVENNPEQRIASERGAGIAAQVFADRLRSAAGKNDVLEKLSAMLAKFIEVAPDEVMAEHGATVNFLARELDKAMEVQDISLDALD